MNATDLDKRIRDDLARLSERKENAAVVDKLIADIGGLTRSRPTDLATVLHNVRGLAREAHDALVRELASACAHDEHKHEISDELLGEIMRPILFTLRGLQCIESEVDRAIGKDGAS